MVASVALTLVSQHGFVSHWWDSVSSATSGQDRPPSVGAMQVLFLDFRPVVPQLPAHADHSPKSVQQAGASHAEVSTLVDCSGQARPPLVGAMQFMVLVLVPVPPQDTEQA